MSGIAWGHLLAGMFLVAATLGSLPAQTFADLWSVFGDKPGDDFYRANYDDRAHSFATGR